MSRKYEYYILNVFSDVGITGGNQLAVILNAETLSDEEMQQITRQFNFSESTFVTRHDLMEADVRIFTPGKEIEYAGHPTIGTINILERINYQSTQKKRDKIYLNLKGGRVRGKILYEGDDIGLVSFEQIPAKFRGNFEDRVKLLNLLGITEDELFDSKPFQIISVTSMQFLFVRLKSPQLLARVSPDYQGLSVDEFRRDDINVYVFASEGVDGGDFRARFFVPLYGVPEDPATGGIQSSFGLCLHRLGLLTDNSVNEIIVEQGYEMGRPSKIYNKFTINNGELVKTETGGNCFYFSTGKLGVG